MSSSNRVFQIAFLISLITHGVILFQNTNFNLFDRQEKREDNKVEVSYLKPLKEIKAPKQITRNKIEPFLKLPTKIALQDSALPPAINKEDIFKPNKETISPKFNFTKPAFIKPEIIAVKKKITLFPISMDKIDSPSYVAYSQVVREKIKRTLYQNYTRMEVGQVYLSFVLANDGYLKRVRLAEDKSSPSPYLREVALRSIKDASPFPNFPKELDYRELSFNVIISFEIE